MIIGFGRAPQKLLEELRKYVDDHRVLIYPEFFDAKLSLIKERSYAKYLEKLIEYRSRIIIAVWPDYYYRVEIARLVDAWIFPMHSVDEIDFVLKLDDHVSLLFLGYPSSKELRDYSLEDFLTLARELDLPMWYLGASPREVREALRYGFDGVDVHTLSIPGWGYRDNRGCRDSPRLIALWLKALAEGRILSRKHLISLTRCKPLI